MTVSAIAQNKMIIVKTALGQSLRSDHTRTTPLIPRQQTRVLANGMQRR
jgi:hypothetical protein